MSSILPNDYPQSLKDLAAMLNRGIEAEPMPPEPPAPAIEEIVDGVEALYRAIYGHASSGTAQSAPKASARRAYSTYQPPKLVIIDLLEKDGSVAQLGCGYAVEVDERA